MTIRTTRSIVTFSNSFLLPNFDAPQPAGDYEVDHDEEMLENNSQIAWRRVGAFIHLPAVGVKKATKQMVPINPAELEMALGKDRAQSSN